MSAPRFTLPTTPFTGNEILIRQCELTPHEMNRMTAVAQSRILKILDLHVQRLGSENADFSVTRKKLREIVAEERFRLLNASN